MCVCAASSTDRHAGFSPGPRKCPERGRWIFEHFAGQVRMDLEFGRIGFMSTQRRENRWQRTSCTEGAGASGYLDPGQAAQKGRAFASGGTAPPGFPASFHPSDKHLLPGGPERLATNSLQLDYRVAMPVRLALQLIRHSSRSSAPPPGIDSAASGRPATFASSLCHIPLPSVFAPLHPALP